MSKLKLEFFAIGLVIVITLGCASQEVVNNEPILPNITANLDLEDSADSIVSKYGKPLYKKGRIDSDGKKVEEWFYSDSILSFKDGSLNAFRPK